MCCNPALQVLSKVHQREMVRYLYNHQNPDGGFGLHIEGESTMFGTGLRWEHLLLVVVVVMVVVMVLPLAC